MKRDQIHIRDLQVLAPHGVYPEEREEGRHFTIDLDAFTLTQEAGQSDELQKTVDYRDLSQAVLNILHGPSKFLIETLAEEICLEIFRLCPPVTALRLSVWKRALGVPGDPPKVGVTIYRERNPLA